MIHNTSFSQYIPPQDFHALAVTNLTVAAGQVAGTICIHKAAAAETITLNVPLVLPSNSNALNGSKLVSVELDYEILVAACTSVTLSIVKVARGLDTAVAVVSAPAGTQLLLPASTAATVNKHKDKFTLTTPEWVLNTSYYFLKALFVCPGTTTLDILAAVANYTFRA